MAAAFNLAFQHAHKVSMFHNDHVVEDIAWFTEMDAQGRGQQPDAPLQEAIYCNKHEQNVKSRNNMKNAD